MFIKVQSGFDLVQIIPQDLFFDQLDIPVNQFFESLPF